MPKALKYIVGGVLGAGITTLAIGGTAFAADADPVAVLGTQTNLLWVILGAVLVIFMQAGFALVETGFTQKKNAAHVMSTNFAIFGLGFVGFYSSASRWPSVATASLRSDSTRRWMHTL